MVLETIFTAVLGFMLSEAMTARSTRAYKKHQRRQPREAEAVRVVPEQEVSNILNENHRLKCDNATLTEELEMYRELVHDEGYNVRRYLRRLRR